MKKTKKHKPQALAIIDHEQINWKARAERAEMELANLKTALIDIFTPALESIKEQIDARVDEMVDDALADLRIDVYR